MTESDVVKKFVGADNTPYFVSVEDIMSSPALGIEERQPLTEVADRMDKHQALHFGVTKGRMLIGLVSVRDFLRLGAFLARPHPSPLPCRRPVSVTVPGIS